MTGYGRSEISSDKLHGHVEIRSKNHRYLDIKVFLPKKLYSLEIPLQKMLKKRIHRGKVDLTLQISGYLKLPASLSLNKELLGEYKKIFDELKSEFGDSGKVDIVNLTQLSDLIVAEESGENIKEYLPEIEESVSKALDALNEMRTFEGKKILEELVSFMKVISDTADKIELKRGEMIGEYHEKVKNKILKVIGESGLDEHRVYQEVAYIIDKTDITEELARLKSHLSQFDNIINEEGSIGKKLDFLFQEMNREVNTIASKANDFNISAFVIEIKNELEKAREQSQNIE
jgi:uncharacterized protein (TIGR00255 family)